MAEDGPITVASAVVVPGGSPEQVNKRRTLSSTLDSSKRPRLSSISGDTPSGIEGGGEGDGGGEAEEVPVMDQLNTIRKRKSLGGEDVKEQERKRGQRLFGALLGTIGKFQQDSQSARAKAGANKRKEIEEKLQQKLKQQNDELDEKKRNESHVLRERMQQQQKLFEERSLELRHANLRAKANYLVTKARPPLYYLPWKLTPDEESRIQEQLGEAEAIIKRECIELETRRAREEEEKSRQHKSTENDHANQVLAKGGDQATDSASGEDNTARGDQDLVNPSYRKHETANVSAPDDEDEKKRSHVTTQDVGDAVIEAGEDTVIY